jgi:competence protein ComEC
VASEPAGLLLMRCAAWLLELLWGGLDRLAGLEFSMLVWPQPPLWSLLLAVTGIALLCVPRGVPGRWSGAFLLLPLVFVSRPLPAAGEAWVALLDVGQGLAAVVRTATHTLVYDTGPAFGEDFDTGHAVVVPYLRYQGVRRVDRLVISHGDNDHIGGARSLLQSYPAADILTSVPGHFAGMQAEDCRRGRQWTWDGVKFAILHPAREDGHQGNDASCVLRIEVAGGQSLLLPGDIEGAGERALLHRYAGRLASTVLVVPHHGSNSSSSMAFISAVSPAVALFPAGYMNRYRFPRPQVVARYSAAGSRLLETGRAGAIEVKLSPQTASPQISRFRADRQRHWRRRE